MHRIYLTATETLEHFTSVPIIDVRRVVLIFAMIYILTAVKPRNLHLTGTQERFWNLKKEIQRSPFCSSPLPTA